ncbi:MAG: M48 family metalloprotease [Proteobacteria bacterium]|nr:M48 family metalloprotease [Pseudomonadota bacterium]
MRYIVLLITLLALAAGCATAELQPVTHDQGTGLDRTDLMQRVPTEQAFLEESGILYEDAKLQHYLDQVIGRLQAASGDKEFVFRLRVIDDPHLNAFAFPNGAIYVHTGILARLDNEAQLAALLAHEMIHCLHRHALRAAGEVKSHAHRPNPFERSWSGADPAHDHSALLGASGFMALVAGYTQKLETEADIGGLEMMSRAGYAPEEALKLFEHLKWEAKAEKIKEPLIFGTHPRLRERMETVGRFLQTLPHVQGEGIKNEARFLENIQRLLLHTAALDLKAGRYDIAQRGVEKFLLVKGPDAKAYFLLGEIFRQMGRPGDNPRAKALYETAILLDPSHADAYKALGLIYYKEKEWVLAKTVFEACVALSPNHPDRAYIEGYLQRCSREPYGLDDRHTDVSPKMEVGS